MCHSKAADVKAGCGFKRKSTVQNSIPSLYYWDVNARAEGIRYCFAYGGVEFNDIRFLAKEWYAYYEKASPNGLAPWLEIDGEKYCESRAILQYAARRSGLWPHSVDDAVAAMRVADNIEDIRDQVIDVVEVEIERMSLNRMLMEDRFAGFIKVMEEGKPIEWLKSLDDVVARTQDLEGHVVGGEMSFADMSVASYLRSFCDMAPAHKSRLRESLPHLWRTMELVYAQPAIQRYRRQHALLPELYCDLESFDGQMIRMALAAAGVNFEYKERAEVPQLKSDDEVLAYGLRPCLLWLNTRYCMIPLKSDVYLLGMWSLLDLIRNMAAAWGTSIEADRNAIQRVNQSIMKTQSREGFCIGHTLTFADIAAAAFFEYYMNGHSVGVDAADIQGFRNAHRVVYQIPDVASDMFKFEPTPTLVYFNFAGRGEAIRLLCYAAGIKFNDVRIPLSAWPGSDYKKTSPNGRLPYMHIGDTILCEQPAILTYLAARCNMLPETVEGRYQARALESASADMIYLVHSSLRIRDKLERASALKAGFVDLLTTIETLVVNYKSPKSLPQYLVEDRLTYADFIIAGLLSSFPEELEFDLTQWMSLKAIYDNICSLPQVSTYRCQIGPAESLIRNFDGVQRGL